MTPDDHPGGEPLRAPPRRALRRVLAVFIAIWAAGGGGRFWPIWAILGWGIWLGVHGVKFIGRGDDEGDEHALRRGT